MQQGLCVGPRVWADTPRQLGGEQLERGGVVDHLSEHLVCARVQTVGLPRQEAVEDLLDRGRVAQRPAQEQPLVVDLAQLDAAPMVRGRQPALVAPQVTDAARLADLFRRPCEQAEQRVPGHRVTAIMQDEAANEVLVQESGELGHGLVRLCRRPPVEQQPARQHRQAKRPSRGDPPGGLDEPGDGGFDGRMSGGVARHRAGGRATTSSEIGQ